MRVFTVLETMEDAEPKLTIFDSYEKALARFRSSVAYIEDLIVKYNWSVTEKDMHEVYGAKNHYYVCSVSTWAEIRLEIKEVG